jgi:hypothetical protein
VGNIWQNGYGAEMAMELIEAFVSAIFQCRNKLFAEFLSVAYSEGQPQMIHGMRYVFPIKQR